MPRRRLRTERIGAAERNGFDEVERIGAAERNGFDEVES